MLVYFGSKEIPALTQSLGNVSCYPKKLPALFAVPIRDFAQIGL